ncbi:MAG: Lrp/AsnC family transcriptional regulator [Pseudomonadales bacterium]
MSDKATARIDSFDRKILSLVQQSNRTTSEQIAERVGLSPAAVQRRLKKMREQHIIQADVSVVSPKAVGRPVTLLVQVTLEREQADLIDQFKKEMKLNPAVQQCYYVTGSSDFMLIITAKDMEDYEALTRKIFFANRNIRSFLTNVVMDSVKTTLCVPVSED